MIVIHSWKLITDLIIFFLVGHVRFDKRIPMRDLIIKLLNLFVIF